jgi:hypothetical protein
VLTENEVSPSVVLEPTCGRGSYLISSLNEFPNCKRFVGIEMYKPYLDEAKLNVLEYMLRERPEELPQIEFYHQNIFEVGLGAMFSQHEGKILILGNPPWVTNAVLGVLNSANTPLKSNFKGLNGFDAITGKSNFDISEYILIRLISEFSDFDGWISFLVKNSVVKNIVYDQRKAKHRIGNIQQQSFDAKKEFAVSVEASNFFCSLNQDTDYQCLTKNIYTRENSHSYGWIENKFVARIEQYKESKKCDGLSPIVWRSGLKHDCSRVFELKKEGDKYVNKKGEKIVLEEDIVYPFLKSSDLKGTIISESRRRVIATQKKIGDDTAYIKETLPQTFAYLNKHRALIDKRKSSIYRGKPPFSIFGIGEYSFQPYKVAISGLYKRATFSLILPENGKPFHLDDTCYFLSFANKMEAFLTYKILNHPQAQSFLRSIVFLDTKRPYNKDVLMRLSLPKIHQSLNFSDFDFSDYPDSEGMVSRKDWDNYLARFSS